MTVFLVVGFFCLFVLFCFFKFRMFFTRSTGQFLFIVHKAIGYFFFPSHCALKKQLHLSSCVKPFAQQKWFLVASKTKCSEHSRKHINRLILFLRL